MMQKNILTLCVLVTCFISCHLPLLHAGRSNDSSFYAPFDLIPKEKHNKKKSRAIKDKQKERGRYKKASTSSSRSGSLRGPAGENGKAGERGPAGAIGPVGAAGAAGLPGPRGTQGEQGPRGERGEQGSQGERGATGEQGLAGIAGADGAIGLPGATGPTGADGALGRPGATGATGTRGAKGATGATGAPAPSSYGFAFEPTGTQVSDATHFPFTGTAIVNGNVTISEGTITIKSPGTYVVRYTVYPVNNGSSSQSVGVMLHLNGTAVPDSEVRSIILPTTLSNISSYPLNGEYVFVNLLEDDIIQLFNSNNDGSQISFNPVGTFNRAFMTIQQIN